MSIAVLAPRICDRMQGVSVKWKVRASMCLESKFAALGEPQALLAVSGPEAPRPFGVHGGFVRGKQGPAPARKNKDEAQEGKEGKGG